MASADPKADNCEGCHERRNQAEEVYGHFEVFWHDDDVDHGWERGWHWTTVDAKGNHFVGTDFLGPFNSSDEAYDDARAA